MKYLILTLALVACPALQAAELRLIDVLDSQPTLNPAIPKPEDVVGVKVGERLWYHHEIITYLDAVADASPRMRPLGTHARSYGGRELVTYAISSPANLERLGDIKAARRDIIDVNASPDLTAQPAVIHMMYSIHGNEPSGANSTPLVAYYLSAVDDPSIEAQLGKVVIVLNPMQNPDGLDRFAHWSNSHRGQVPSTDRNDREHTEAFPGGRTNYYWFDLNRDWLPHQHPESRGRLTLFHEWKPNVQLDFHEQGSDNSYFFMPGKPERTHPLTPPINQELTDRIADYHRRVFDKHDILYFSEEGYDDFFMGKGSTYPDLFGCVGILFEQPSARGSHQDTPNGLLTFPVSIANQFRTSLSSIEATAALKDELLAYQRQFYVDNARENRSRRGFYLASAEGDPTRLKEFVRVLRGHQIDVRLVTSDVRAEGELFRANRAVAIPAAQTQSAFLQSLWRSQIEFEENVFYDVSTWTIPWAFNVTHSREPVRNVQTAPLQTGTFTQARDLSGGSVGYLIDWRDSASPALLYALLDAEANVRVATRPLTASIPGKGQMEFGYGTLFVSRALDEAISDEAMELLKEAARSGIPVYPVASSATRAGIDLGSRDFEVLKLPKVLMATGPGVSSSGVGEIWHLLDQRLHMPVTMADTGRLAAIDLNQYTHVLLLNPVKSLSDTGIENLKQFVSKGGVLFAQGEDTIKWLVDKQLTSVTWRKTAEEKAQDARKKKSETNGDDTDDVALPERKPFAVAEDEAAFKLIRGTILQGSLDITHPLGYGYTDEFLPVFRRSAKFMDRSENAYSSPVVYAGSPLLSGYMSNENRELAGGSAGLIVDQDGEGAIVLSLDSLTFRAFWWGTQRLLVNAIFFGGLLEEPQ